MWNKPYGDPVHQVALGSGRTGVVPHPMWDRQIEQVQTQIQNDMDMDVSDRFQRHGDRTVTAMD